MTAIFIGVKDDFVDDQVMLVGVLLQLRDIVNDGRHLLNHLAHRLQAVAEDGVRCAVNDAV